MVCYVNSLELVLKRSDILLAARPWKVVFSTGIANAIVAPWPGTAATQHAAAATPGRGSLGGVIADDHTSLSSCELHPEQAFIMGWAERAQLEYKAVCGKVRAPEVRTTLALVMGHPVPIAVAGDLGVPGCKSASRKGVLREPASVSEQLSTLSTTFPRGLPLSEGGPPGHPAPFPTRAQSHPPASR